MPRVVFAPMSHIDKLALVSKLILDERVLSQRREMEGLRLELFWKDHNIERLIILMREVNSLCNCFNCQLVGINRPSVQRSDECQFDDWFRSHVLACGMTVGSLDAATVARPFHMSHAYFCQARTVYDVDAHFYQQEDSDCSHWKYGSKLWKAKSVSELANLHALFQRLEATLEPV